MSKTVIKVEDLSKYYKLGVINNGALFRDIQTWIALKRGKADPHSKIDESKYDGNADGFWALKDLNLEINQGDRIGIIGKNGAGKSTLLKILSRITSPTTGSVKIRGRVASLLEVGTGFHGELTGRENIYLNGAILGMKKKEVDRKIDEIIDFSGIEKHIDTPVKRYSSGMYVRLAFAVAAHLDSEILIADEVLAVGDASFQKKAIGKMNELSEDEGRTVLFVSHNMAAVKNLCNKGMILEKGQLKFLSDGIEKAIQIYNGKSNKNEKYFKHGILKYAKIYQHSSKIILEAKYSKQDLQDPYLGFVIYDIMGYPVFGINPRNIERIYSSSLDDETIKIEIIEPRLLKGIYNISLWLGNASGEDIDIQEKCLQITVDDPFLMLYPNEATNVGSVFPTLKYFFS